MTSIRESHNELTGLGRRLREAIPDVYAGYAQLSRAAMGDGALPARIKELIALSIAVTRECDGCIVAHARSAHRSGVTAEEVAEALGVVILMNGGPGTVWGPRLRRLRGVRRRGGRLQLIAADRARLRLTAADRAAAAEHFTCGRRVLTLVVCGTWRRFAGRNLRRCGRDRSGDPCGAADP